MQYDQGNVSLAPGPQDKAMGQISHLAWRHLHEGSPGMCPETCSKMNLG